MTGTTLARVSDPLFELCQPRYIFRFAPRVQKRLFDAGAPFVRASLPLSLPFSAALMRITWHSPFRFFRRALILRSNHSAFQQMSKFRMIRETEEARRDYKKRLV